MNEDGAVAADGTEDQLDRTFRALSDGTRRQIISRLARGPATVSEVAEPFPMSLPAVSQHLTVLEKAGMIARTAEGRTRRCTFDTDSLRVLDDWLHPYRIYWAETLTALGDHAERARTRPRTKPVGR
ncbi:MAG: ArsR/SmtB family transcription factor [Thermoplasmata archaeon]